MAGSMMTALQTSLPYDPFSPRKLPGISPLDMAEWLIFDEAFAAQMAERDRLLAERRADVLALDDSAREAAGELLELVLDIAYPGAGEHVTRGDGVQVNINRTDPMGTLGRLVQDDFCLLQKHGDQHVLTGAVLCFPASWMLSEKFMHPLTGIHEPVDAYDDNIAARVQRLFDGVQPDRPLWRFNALWYSDAALFQPRSIHDRRPGQVEYEARYFRSERQSVVRLPKSRAVVFSIHTFVLKQADALRLRDIAGQQQK